MHWKPINCHISLQTTWVVNKFRLSLIKVRLYFTCRNEKLSDWGCLVQTLCDMNKVVAILPLAGLITHYVTDPIDLCL